MVVKWVANYTMPVKTLGWRILQALIDEVEADWGNLQLLINRIEALIYF